MGSLDLPYPHVSARRVTVALRDGTVVLLRPATAADRALLVDGFQRLSRESRYRRFFAPVETLSPSLVDYLVDVDGVDHVAYAAVVADAGREVGAGVGRYFRLPDGCSAEVAITVVDAYQGKGLGGLLFDALIRHAAQNGVERFEGDVLGGNGAMEHLLRRAGARFRSEGNGVLHFELDVTPAGEAAQRP